MLIVDPATGAMYKLPEFVSADMGKPVASANESALTVALIESLSESQRASLISLD